MINLISSGKNEELIIFFQQLQVNQQGAIMAKQRYSYEKRQREIEKKKKKELKQQRKTEKKKEFCDAQVLGNESR